MSQLDNIVSGFVENLRGVEKLINFDRDVLDITVTELRQLHERLKTQGLENPKLNVETTLRIVSQIRQNDSLRPRYQTIFNQAVVLLVSYFASALGDIFRHGVSARLDGESAGALFEEEFKLSFLELKERDWNLKDHAPDLLIAKKDLSFQDMGATHKAFRGYLGVDLERDRRVNNIILTQACRHVIVHSGGRISDRLLRQVASAAPRDLKSSLELNAPIQFSPEEVGKAASEMQAYVEALARKVEAAVHGAG